jgi:hypothetical protein
MAQADKRSPTLGKEIPWERVKGHIFRVKSCHFFASIENGTVKAPPVGAYAVLVVECPKCPSLTGEALVMVSHKVDFKHLWELYKQRQVADDEEVMVGYGPVGERGLGKLFRTFLPFLTIWAVPKGHFDELYDPAFKPTTTDWYRNRAKWTASEP